MWREALWLPHAGGIGFAFTRQRSREPVCAVRLPAMREEPHCLPSPTDMFTRCW
jgi:hypothetical protein